ncbi:hypothetical protein ABK905_21325 [Acerihabitans sp. KWT182]|uniref:Type VI secretion system spike protein VgrG3-like C-terminal domain-containing protein n=1 Tax=Acerihabitans sp. KWT182 TaxID=3157919 RepID=A0AAU7Q9G6_9GAMM
MAAALGDDPLPTVEARFTRQSETRRHRAEGKEWVYIPRERAWLAAEEVSVVHQFDLAKRGFVLLEQQDPPRTLRQTPGEGWLRRGFHRLAELARQNTRDMDSLSYIEGYQRLLREMELGEEGQVSGDALWRFLHNRQPHIQNQVQRLIVKHHSEWLHDGLSALWRAALDEQAKHQPDLARYNREFVDALVWMREVPEIRSGEALWHLHPIRFLEAIAEKEIIYWELGKTSERYESAGRGPGVISTGKGDHGGASYGSYQFSSKKGVVHKYVAQSKFKHRFFGLQPATDEFNKVWKDIAKESEKLFLAEQWEFTKKTHYDVQISFLAKRGIAITHKRAAIHDMIWSTCVQYGPYTDVIIEALSMVRITFDSSSDDIIVRTVQHYKHNNVERRFAKSPKLWSGLKDRALREEIDLLNLHSKMLEIM